MCARYTQTAPASRVAEAFGVVLPFDVTARYNVAPTQTVPAGRLNQSGEREAVQLRWGLIPSWATDMKIGVKLLNARADTVASSLRMARWITPPAKN
jgi:putative SOS response-associated peptidase YedK